MATGNALEEIGVGFATQGVVGRGCRRSDSGRFVSIQDVDDFEGIQEYFLNQYTAVHLMVDSKDAPRSLLGRNVADLILACFMILTAVRGPIVLPILPKRFVDLFSSP